MKDVSEVQREHVMHNELRDGNHSDALRAAHHIPDQNLQADVQGRIEDEVENDRTPLEASFLQVDLLQNQMRDGVHDAQVRRGESQQFEVVAIQEPARGGQQDVQCDSVHPIEIHAHPLR